MRDNNGSITRIYKDAKPTAVMSITDTPHNMNDRFSTFVGIGIDNKGRGIVYGSHTVEDVIPMIKLFSDYIKDFIASVDPHSRKIILDFMDDDMSN